MWRPSRACLLPLAVSLITPCASLRHGGSLSFGAAAGEPNATLKVHGLEPAGGAGADPGNATERKRLKVVVMIMTAPGAFEWRQLVRKHLPEATKDVRALGRDVELVTRFAVGKAQQMLGGMRCMWEAATYGDMAMLDVPDGIREAHSDGQHGGKIWFVFKWALDHFPEADLFFKQDDDSIVNWRIALPTMLDKVWKAPAKLPFERMYLGRLQYEFDDPCGMGELYGFSKDIVMFGTQFTKPEVMTEDVFTCHWVQGMEMWIGELAVDRGGLLKWPAYENAWIHPVKDKQVYEDCFKNLAGCMVEYPWGDHQNITFRLLPSVEAARLWMAHNSTATEEVKL